MALSRSSGLLLPVASLPGRHGIGSFNAEAYHFVDLLAAGGFKLWQILPLNPLGYGHSPYQPFSSFAFDDLYIDLDALTEEGYLEAVPPFHQDSDKILYEEVKAYKDHFLRLAYDAQMAKQPHCLEAFVLANPWVKDWAAFILYKKRNSMASWDTWPLAMQDWIKTRPAFLKNDLYDYNYEIWLQMTLYRQWDKLHSYANSKGISIIGDIPFYVGFDSCDVWANQSTFLLDQLTHQPSFIAGVPPDYFSKTGQRWGNPIYNWDLLAKTDFAFLENRILGNAKIYDIVRLDHFRAFDTFWKIPSSCPTAIDGQWIEAPGYAFFDSLLAKKPELKAKIIAEDLGDLRPQVLTLRDHYDFPGMNVIEFTFTDAEVVHKAGVDWNKENSVCYLGTHDNDMMKGFYEKLDEGNKRSWNDALNRLGFTNGTINERFIAYALSKKAGYAIFALQDILELGSEARINVPGIVDNINWTWRLLSFDRFAAKIDHLKELNLAAHR
jgi:4-alpha-glucanotransferase